MSQYNLGSLSSGNNAIQVVSAGDPPTLILNHSTKNTIYIGESNAVGTGNLLDATPLDPYASIVMNGNANVFAVAADQAQPATVYTYQNAINWTPKAIQPNIIDSHSPLTPGLGTHSTTLEVPPTAQGLFVSWQNPSGFTDILVTGLESGITYANVNPSTLADNQIWIPILSDADTTVRLNTTASTAPLLYLVWIMTSFMAGPVETGQTADVNIANVTVGSGSVPITGDVRVTNDANVNETNIQTFANQVPVSFNVTLAASASTVLLPASVGVQYYIHEIRCECTTAGATMFADFEDTSGSVFARLVQEVDGTPVNSYRPSVGTNNMHGFPNPMGLGVQLVNAAAASAHYVGQIIYSQ